MFESAQWPLVWAGFLLIAVSVRLSVTVRAHRHRRLRAERRPSHLEWLPGLAGLIAVVDDGPRVLRADGTVLAVTGELARIAGAGVLVLALYGAIVLVRRPRG
ncbi:MULTISPECIES: hypothetical protein [Kitasatospora]|uniref:Uncharacterized protein n=1 Tax=Kitasatospora acidiphila TaxID=2567942 RepID=A0A540W7Y7_9ACTN|nr:MULTISPECIES: hypothetical protein [Kitasatospora]MDH6140723.1 membrane protein implicated in regulation of membrane protease activity [Kitasatospora sp. GP30]TQF05125.1 hypothetical protein E6W39_26420 [Kitasatospora acidiphila]